MNAPRPDLHRPPVDASRQRPAPSPEPLWHSALAVFGTLFLVFALFFVAHVAGGR